MLGDKCKTGYKLAIHSMQKQDNLPPILSLPVATVPVCSWLAIKKKKVV
jgi:hypothetical protein